MECGKPIFATSSIRIGKGPVCSGRQKFSISDDDKSKFNYIHYTKLIDRFENFLSTLDLTYPDEINQMRVYNNELSKLLENKEYDLCFNLSNNIADLADMILNRVSIQKRVNNSSIYSITSSFYDLIGRSNASKDIINQIKRDKKKL